MTNIVGKKYFLDVNVEHLIMANEHLADKLKNEPADMLPLVFFNLFKQSINMYSSKKRLKSMLSKRSFLPLEK